MWCGKAGDRSEKKRFSTPLAHLFSSPNSHVLFHPSMRVSSAIVCLFFLFCLFFLPFSLSRFFFFLFSNPFSLFSSSHPSLSLSSSSTPSFFFCPVLISSCSSSSHSISCRQFRLLPVIYNPRHSSFCAETRPE